MKTLFILFILGIWWRPPVSSVGAQPTTRISYSPRETKYGEPFSVTCKMNGQPTGELVIEKYNGDRYRDKSFNSTVCGSGQSPQIFCMFNDNIYTMSLRYKHFFGRSYYNYTWQCYDLVNSVKTLKSNAIRTSNALNYAEPTVTKSIMGPVRLGDTEVLFCTYGWIDRYIPPTEPVTLRFSYDFFDTSRNFPPHVNITRGEKSITMTINGIRKEDAREYYCHGINRAGSYFPVYVRIDVIDTATDISSVYSTLNFSSPSPHFLDDTLTIQCNISKESGKPAVPNSNYSWYFMPYNDEGKIMHLEEKSENLTFNQLKREDRGIYQCCAEDITGRPCTKFEEKSKIEVIALPSFVNITAKPSTNVFNLTRDEATSVFCGSDEFPQGDRSLLQLTSDGEQKQLNSTAISLDPMNYENYDWVSFQCLVDYTDKLGHSIQMKSEPLNFTVIAPIANVKLHANKPTPYVHNDPLSLRCVSSGGKPPIISAYSWFFKPYNKGGQIMHLRETGQYLKIDGLDRDDSGQYQCCAQSIAGRLCTQFDEKSHIKLEEDKDSKDKPKNDKDDEHSQDKPKNDKDDEDRSITNAETQTTDKYNEMLAELAKQHMSVTALAVCVSLLFIIMVGFIMFLVIRHLHSWRNNSNSKKNKHFQKPDEQITNVSSYVNEAYGQSGDGHLVQARQAAGPVTEG